jgi:uncharacterized protein YsxB (DUF464 family)
MERTYGLICTAVSFVAFLIVVGIIVVMLGSAIQANPGVQHLINVLGH